MANTTLITVVTDPSVPIKELWTSDDSSVSKQNSSVVKTSVSRSAKEKVGSDSPYIKINSVPIVDIDEVILDETGLIPTIKVVFVDTSGALSGPNYPKNDPILSLYIKTGNPKLKPIRCDFLITRIKTNIDPVLNRDNIESGATFVMSGELYVPKIYNNVSKSYSGMNSKDALKAIASEVDLGYADTEFSPLDNMTWLNTNRSSLDFIKHVTRHSYMTDDSFFTSFIDKYYHLTYINIADQLNPSRDVNLTYDNIVDASQFEASQLQKEKANEELSEELTIVALTNKEEYKDRPEYIISYSLMGDTGSILKSKGFKKKIYYYDHTLDIDRFTSFYVNPIYIKGFGNDNKTTGLVPEDDILKESIIKKWMNIDYGNAHDQWNASVLINDHNNSELNKVKLMVETAGINFQITRGNAVPVNLFQTVTQITDRDVYRLDRPVDGEIGTKLDSDTIVPDFILSGRYYVSGVKYIYDKLDTSYPYKTQFQLSRFNWLSENNTVE
jgi:hypothetical protein